jgi:hypothetical protein
VYRGSHEISYQGKKQLHKANKPFSLKSPRTAKCWQASKLGLGEQNYLSCREKRFWPTEDA